MFLVKPFLCFLTFVVIFTARWIRNNTRLDRLISYIVVSVAAVVGLSLCVVVIATNWTVFTIPKLLLFISCCLYIWFKEEFEICFPFWIGIVITIVAYIVAGIMWCDNVEKCEVPDVVTTKQTIICAKDNSSTSGYMSGLIYVQGSVSEKSVYKYYYKLEDGGIKQGTIPADSTIIYFVEPGMETYLEKIVTTEYWLNNNNNPATRFLETSDTTYKFYVPEGSVTNVYEFNAE